jgi:hypothetical protein
MGSDYSVAVSLDTAAPVVWGAARERVTSTPTVTVGK